MKKRVVLSEMKRRRGCLEEEEYYQRIRMYDGMSADDY